MPQHFDIGRRYGGLVLPAPGPSIIPNREFMIDQRKEGASREAVPGDYIVDQWYLSTDSGSGGTPPTVSRITAGVPAGFTTALEMVMDEPTTGEIGLYCDFPDCPAIKYGTNGASSLYVNGMIWSSRAGRVLFYWTSFGASGGTYVTYFDLKAETWNEVGFLIPPPTEFDPFQSASFRGAFIGLIFKYGFANVIDNSVLNKWVSSGDFTGYPAAGMGDLYLPGTVLRFVGFDVRLASQPYEFVHDDPRDYLRECQFFYRKTFPVGLPTNGFAGVAPAQGATQDGALVAIGNGSRVFVPWPFDYGFPMIYGPVVTLYNPVSANAQFRDTTANADVNGGFVTGPDGQRGMLRTSVNTTAGNVLRIHATANTNF